MTKISKENGVELPRRKMSAFFETTRDYEVDPIV